MLGWILNSITAVFVVLKAVGTLTWSWWAVCIPTFIWLGLIVVSFALIFLGLMALGSGKPTTRRNYGL